MVWINEGNCQDLLAQTAKYCEKQAIAVCPKWSHPSESGWYGINLPEELGWVSQNLPQGPRPEG